MSGHHLINPEQQISLAEIVPVSPVRQMPYRTHSENNLPPFRNHSLQQFHRPFPPQEESFEFAGIAFQAVCHNDIPFPVPVTPRSAESYNNHIAGVPELACPIQSHIGRLQKFFHAVLCRKSMVMERTDLRASGPKLHAVLRSKMLSAFKPFDATHD